MHFSNVGLRLDVTKMLNVSFSALPRIIVQQKAYSSPLAEKGAGRAGSVPSRWLDVISAVCQ